MRHDQAEFKRVFLAYLAEHGGEGKPSEVARMYADAWEHALTKTMAVVHTQEGKERGGRIASTP